MPYFHQTERLSFRPLVKEDFPFMCSLHTNKQIMKHIGTGLPRSEEQSQVAMDLSLQIEKEDGRLGSWVVELKPDLGPIGMLIIRRPATKQKIAGLEIGYSFLPLHWGKGYAQETVLAMIKYAYQQFGPERIIALIKPANAASRNVLTKTGFVAIGMTEYVDPTNGQKISSEILEIPKPE
jgi:RimJ/RimL family protein N-acetyltransferase